MLDTHENLRTLIRRLSLALCAGALGCATSQAVPDATQNDVEPKPDAVVKWVELGGEAPEDTEVAGTFHKAIGWYDRYGRSAIVMGIERSESGDRRKALLTADLVLWEGSAWTLQRRFRQLVDICQFDLELEAFVGRWSVTDLNNDGFAEATFAWRSGCRSDVSPISHKVLMVTYKDGEVVKYALRGQSAVDDGSGKVLGGTYEADPAFQNAPNGFLNHATTVWTMTVTERFR